MDRILKQDLSKNEVIDLLRGMDAQEVEGNFSVRRVLIDTRRATYSAEILRILILSSLVRTWHCITRVLTETHIRSLREYAKA